LPTPPQHCLVASLASIGQVSLHLHDVEREVRYSARTVAQQLASHRIASHRIARAHPQHGAQPSVAEVAGKLCVRTRAQRRPPALLQSCIPLFALS
jgi:hypothetical protein